MAVAAGGYETESSLISRELSLSLLSGMFETYLTHIATVQHIVDTLQRHQIHLGECLTAHFVSQNANFSAL